MSNPRIIGGTARGIRLDPVPGDSTRPITDRVKEALFNILSSDMQEARFLDLFGGTGSVGIEAISRGASSCLFLEINEKALRTIKTNLEKTHTVDRGRVLRMDALKYLSALPEEAFDYIYIAPPQYKELWLKSLKILDSNIALLDEDGWVITQIHPVEYQTVDLLNLTEFDQRKYGSTLLVFFERKKCINATAR
ncbi:MAG TPA: 16S rRNA (guanine(966)-N(2))-methyltransferase RsmD [Anaerolineaceae bacterium]|nr:16S rRNA (guanine(966)-N(2))-methyltransferase RsmD [Anaerolineaceae bacterium]